MTITLRSCKHRDNTVSINQEAGVIIVDGRGKNSWSDLDTIKSTLDKTNVILNFGIDNDITITFEEGAKSIPIVVGCPGNNSGDNYNDPIIYSALSKLRQGSERTIKGEGAKEKILEILSGISSN